MSDRNPDASVEHYRKLQHLYASAPVTQWYGAAITIADGHAEVRFAVKPEFFHAAHAVHAPSTSVPLMMRRSSQ